MSSGRESVGDLIPPDVLQVIAEERQGGRGKRGRRRAASFSRAFRWLKRQRRKQRQRATEIRDLLAPGSPVELPQSLLNTDNAVGSYPLREFQENVFVEGNRPKYVLDLHTEAQVGLKLLQQEEDKNGTDYPDDQSMISTATTRTEDSMAFSELRGFESESTAADSVSMRSSVSSRSTRSGLRRQASTFRPLKPDKTQEKTKSHRRHLRTVVGIPRHVQRELGLDRAAWITTNLDEQLPNGAVVLPAIVSTVDGAYKSLELQNVQGHLHGMENLRTGLRTLAKPSDDGSLQRLMNNPVDPEKSGTAVPSLTVPGNPYENPHSAVMSISPQATYMSKIIPNAVLPPAVDVVELSRGPSRSSVRTVSKSSLVPASPGSSRASSRVSSRRSTVRSNYSGWSRSDSSETLVSDSSTISSSSTPRVASRESQVENLNRPDKMKSQVYRSHNASAHVNGDTTDGENSRKTESAGAFTRNLSVMKKSKRPPAPPSRSYSLHNGKQARNKSESPSYMTPPELRRTKIISPYSGQSNENRPTTYLSKQIQPAKMLAELKMRENLKMSSVNSPRSYTNGNSKLAEFRKTLLSAKTLLNGKTNSPAVMALWSLLDIPEHPKVLAPPAPPPETWAHNQHTFELLCGPGPVNYARWAKKRGLKIVDVPQPEILANKHGVKAQSMLQTVDLKGKVAKPPPLPPDIIPPIPAPATLWWQTKPPPHTVPPPPASAEIWWQTRPPPDPVAPASPPAEVWWQTQSPPDAVDSTLSPAAQAITHLTAWIPPHPLFPPPVPPVDPVSATPDAVQDDTVIPPPPPFSQQSILTMPHLPSHIPPPPPQVPPPPPQVPPPPVPPPHVPPPHVPPPPPHIPPPPPQVPPPHVPPPPPQKVPPPQVSPPQPPPLHEVPPPPPAPPPAPKKTSTPPQEAKQSTLLTSTASHQAYVPPAPPLPTDLKKEVRLVTAEKEEKRSSSTTVTKEETSSPVVTQSLLQMVRLRSVKSNQNQVVDPNKPSHPTQKSGVSQDAPSKPVRRSLIITALPPDVEALSSAEPKTEAPPPDAICYPINATAASDTQQGSAEPETQSVNVAQNVQNTRLQPICSLATGAPTNTNNKMTTAERATKPTTDQPCTEAELKPSTLVEQIQPTASEPSTLHSTTEPKDQSVISQPKTQLPTQEPNKTNHYSVKQAIIIETPSKPDHEQPETQASSSNPPVLSPTPPIISPPANPSMRLQDAIRLKAAAISSKDNQGKCFGLRSPPPATGGNTAPNSPASTASFIFSKNTKKVVIETPTSPVIQADLRRTLVTELATVSGSSKSVDSNKTAVKFPPPVAMKPKAKVDSAAETEPVAERRYAQTETVQTAGQEVQTETSDRTTNE